MNPTDQTGNTSLRRRGSTLLGVLTLLAVLCVIALLALQILEVVFYGKPPSVWPPS